MTRRGPIDGTLTNTVTRQAAFLTLVFFLLLATRFCMADGIPTPQEIAADKQRLSQAASYIRNQSTQGLALLPNELRQTFSWFSGYHHAISLPYADERDDSEEPNSSLIDKTESTDTATGLDSNFHHRGFLPTHDAMLVGIATKQNIIDNKLQFTARPFYGQNWHSLQGYWGQEVAMNIAERPDGMPWGKISAGYVGGNEALTDHGRGIEWHGDINLTNGFTLTSGLRQDTIVGDSNYFMVNWHMNFQ